MSSAAARSLVIRALGCSREGTIINTRLSYRAPPIIAAASAPMRSKYSSTGDERIGSDLKSLSQLWLEERFRFGNDDVAKMVVAAPGIETLDESVLEQRVDWLKAALALDTDVQLGRVIKKNPGILAGFEDLKPKLEFLKRRLRWDDASLSKIVRSHPSLLNPGSEDTIEPRLKHLQKRLSWNDAVLSKVLRSSPAILYRGSAEDNIEYLRNRLGVGSITMGKLAKREPGLLGLSIPSDIEPTLDWFEDRLRLNKARVARIVVEKPDLLTRNNPENMELIVKWLQHRLLVGDDQLPEVIPRSLPILDCGIENDLERAYKFYEKELKKEKAIGLLRSDPVLLCYSLPRRLLPRRKETKELGLDIDEAMLRRMARHTDDDWKKSLLWTLAEHKNNEEKNRNNPHGWWQ